MRDWSAVITKLREVTGDKLELSRIRHMGGGCINSAAMLDLGPRRYFVKHNDRSRLEMFVAEAEGLRALAAAKAVRVPAPVCWGTSEDAAFLVLEYLQLSTLAAAAEDALGTQLAALHRITQAQFGWHRNNTIGASPQLNAYSATWPEFFRDRRLGYQLGLAAAKGYRALSSQGERLLAHVGAFFRNYTPPPSLLHGDLWGGNVGATRDGEPVIYDPAVYFGDREADLAMTALFGGFSERFYRSYEAAWPLAPGYEMRRTLYNLYHALNHLNLFGRSYLAQCERMLGQLLAETR